MPRFELGQPVITPGAMSLLADQDVGALALLDRHISGDWGELEETDRLTNEDALVTEGRLLSRYLVGENSTSGLLPRLTGPPRPSFCILSTKWSQLREKEVPRKRPSCERLMKMTG